MQQSGRSESNGLLIYGRNDFFFNASAVSHRKDMAEGLPWIVSAGVGKAEEKACSIVIIPAVTSTENVCNAFTSRTHARELVSRCITSLH